MMYLFMPRLPEFLLNAHAELNRVKGIKSMIFESAFDTDGSFVSGSEVISDDANNEPTVSPVVDGVK